MWTGVHATAIYLPELGQRPVYTCYRFTGQTSRPNTGAIKDIDSYLHKSMKVPNLKDRWNKMYSKFNNINYL